MWIVKALRELALAEGKNKALWTGAEYPGANVRLALSEPISQQPKGIVLLWSGATNGAAANYDYQTVFIPKQAVADHPGAGWDANLVAGSTFSRKYLYINDAEIVGNADNSLATKTIGGVTVRPDYFVLRAVYGI